MIDNLDKQSIAYALSLDAKDELASFRDKFHFPTQKNGDIYTYLCGNSLGLQPKATAEFINNELAEWKNLGVEGHWRAQHPWVDYNDLLRDNMAKVVGAKPLEVVVMNTLTVNLHLMMISFYQPIDNRNKILIEADAFPSDKYAAQSQIRLKGLDPKECLMELSAREGEDCLREEDILAAIDEQGEDIALVLLGNTNYYTGQYFDMKKISEAAHAKGCKVGFDCAHGAGNLPLNLHDSDCDFAVWCNYKYLCAGPGCLAGAFVHERYATDNSLPRLEGWWGHNKEIRFNMRDGFDPIPGVEGWQLSNPPVLSMASIRSSLQLFNDAGMDRLRKKSIALTSYLEELIKSIGNHNIHIITPTDPEQRGSQLSIQLRNCDKSLFQAITNKGIIADWREPDVIRVAPAAIYNSFEDVNNFYSILEEALSDKS